MGAVNDSRVRVFVHLAHGFGAQHWEDRWRTGELIGINERLPYGYFRAEEHGCRVAYSGDKDEGLAEKFARLAIRALLGFDFLHAWRNRRGIFQADVVWTHTESQHLAVSLLFLIAPRGRPPKLIAQSVWLFDRWPNYWFLKQRAYAKLVSQADVLTVLSPKNLDRARELFPNSRSELVLFGIKSDEMAAPRPRVRQPVRVISLGNDEHRDWATTIDAFKGWCCEARIASARVSPKLAVGIMNISIVRPRSNRELLELFEWADFAVVAVNPNLHASGCTVIQEAVVRGLPVICSDTGGLRSYFSDREVRYVPAQNPAAIRAALGDLAMDDEARVTMVRRAQARMGPNGLSSHSYARTYAELSRELLYGRGTAPEHHRNATIVAADR